MTTVAEPRAADREVSPVLAFVGRRLLGAAVSLLVASVLIFIGTSVLPGNAASVVLGGVTGGVIGNHLGKEDATTHASRNASALDTLAGIAHRPSSPAAWCRNNPLWGLRAPTEFSL